MGAARWKKPFKSSKKSPAAVVTAEYLAAIALQTGRAKDRERVIRLLEEADIDRTVFDRILESFGLAEKFKKLEKQIHEE
jgi:hypothetical protein